MNKKENPNTIIPEHYIRQGDTEETKSVCNLGAEKDQPGSNSILMPGHTSKTSLKSFFPYIAPNPSSGPTSYAAEPEPRIDPSGEHCLSEASCAALLIRDGGGGTPKSRLYRL